MQQLRIPNAEHADRHQRLLARATDDGYDGVVLFGAIEIQYISGFFHLPRERPVALGVTPDAVHIVVPEIEADHAAEEMFIHDEVHSYFEYPQSNPMDVVATMCAELGIDTGNVAVDSDGSPGRMGYDGPALSDVISATVTVESYTRELRQVKSNTEISLIREASRWANLGQQLLQENLEPGRRPTEISAEVQRDGSKTMLDTLGDRYVMTGWRPPMVCKFTSGRTTAQPHSVDRTGVISEGENIVTVLKPHVGGYGTELERTMFVGEPSADQQHYFSIMKEAQQIAFETLGPGVEYAAVEEAVTSYFEEHGVNEYTKHHIGHNLGLEGHEPPFLDRGEEGTMTSGEVFAVEPGFYIPDVGGFRHSDTVVLTEDGAERLTYYPRSIDQLTVC